MKKKASWWTNVCMSKKWTWSVWWCTWHDSADSKKRWKDVVTLLWSWWYTRVAAYSQRQPLPLHTAASLWPDYTQESFSCCRTHATHYRWTTEAQEGNFRKEQYAQKQILQVHIFFWAASPLLDVPADQRHSDMMQSISFFQPDVINILFWGRAILPAEKHLHAVKLGEYVQVIILNSSRTDGGPASSIPHLPFSSC